MAINLNFHQSNEQLQEELIIIEAAKINPNQFAPLYTKYYEQIFNYIYLYKMFTAQKHTTKRKRCCSCER